MQHPNRAADSHELRPLTGIRGFAASLVVFAHFYGAWVLLLPALRPWAALAARGHLGVDLFFILSGFILCYVYRAGDKELSLKAHLHFLWLRLARIYPNHLATLCFLGLLVALGKYRGVSLSGNYPLSGLPFQLTLTQALPFVENAQWNYPAWSISAEWFAYLGIFPAVSYLLRLKWGVVSSLVIAYVTLSLWLWVLTPLKAYAPLLQVSCEFIAGGMFLNVYLHHGRMTRFCQRYSSAIFVILAALLSIQPTVLPLASAGIVLLFPMLLLGLTSETSLLSKFCSTLPALWLGRVSYALYMSHAIALRLIKVLLPFDHYVNSPFAVRLLVLFTHIGLILLLACALYYLVEIPARKYLRRISTPGSHRAPKPVVPSDSGT